MVQVEKTKLENGREILPHQNADLLQLIEEIKQNLMTIENKLELNRQNLADKSQQMLKEFQSKLKYDQHKDAVIDKLHQELQLHKNDLCTKIVEPLIMDIISIIDDIGKIYQTHHSLEPSESSYFKLLGLLKGISDDLEDALYRQGVEKFTEEGMSFNPAKQRILQVDETVSHQLDKKISASVRQGYQFLNGKVIRPELVNVYVCK